MARRGKRRAILLEFGQIILQAQHRWLRPAELCEIIRNHTRLGLLDKPANEPKSGSLLLYDRNVLRHFRNDGHRWKKTKNRRAMKEGHEKLKDEGVEVLHCYYAHGEENGNFQRRIYRMIDQDLSQIALVHYREVKSNRKKFQAGDAKILNTAQASELETAFTFASTSATLTTAVGGGGDVKKGKEKAKVEIQESCGGRKNNFEVGSSSNSKNVEEGDIVKPHEGGGIGGGKLEAQTGNLLSGQQPTAYPEPDIFKELGMWNSAWNHAFESENEVDKFSAPLQEPLFSIIDISPNWAYEKSPTKVTITGRFSKNEQAESCKWSCMFGLTEICAVVTADGLYCCTPEHEAGKFPFYVTCPSRRFYSVASEFEFRVAHAYYSERTVPSVISLDAPLGALTDPGSKYPSGDTPADLASEQGYQRIAGYLAESALSAHFSSLNLDSKEGNTAEISGAKAVSASSRDGELTDGISLIAVSTSDERALSLFAVKSHKPGKRNEHVDAAAVRIQNEFRSWKGRKDFLIIRQQIIKIQELWRRSCIGDEKHVGSSQNLFLRAPACKFHPQRMMIMTY